VAAVLAAMPYVLYQAWSFVAPGMYRHEKRFALPLLVSSIALFYAASPLPTSWCARLCSPS
jgi:sec-independent protein translocase protein TatC